MQDLFIAFGLLAFGGFFSFTAFMKLSRHPHMREEFEKMNLPYGLAYLSGGVEAVCGPLMIIGIWVPFLAAIATALMVPTMLGAAIVNFTGRNARMGIGVVLVFLLPISLLAYAHLDILIAQFITKVAGS